MADGRCAETVSTTHSARIFQVDLPGVPFPVFVSDVRPKQYVPTRVRRLRTYTSAKRAVTIRNLGHPNAQHPFSLLRSATAERSPTIQMHLAYATLTWACDTKSSPSPEFDVTPARFVEAVRSHRPSDSVAHTSMVYTYVRPTGSSLIALTRALATAATAGALSVHVVALVDEGFESEEFTGQFCSFPPCVDVLLAPIETANTNMLMTQDGVWCNGSSVWASDPVFERNVLVLGDRLECPAVDDEYTHQQANAVARCSRALFASHFDESTLVCQPTMVHALSGKRTELITTSPFAESTRVYILSLWPVQPLYKELDRAVVVPLSMAQRRVPYRDLCAPDHPLHILKSHVDGFLLTGIVMQLCGTATPCQLLSGILALAHAARGSTGDVDEERACGGGGDGGGGAGGGGVGGGGTCANGGAREDVDVDVNDGDVFDDALEDRVIGIDTIPAGTFPHVDDFLRSLSDEDPVVCAKPARRIVSRAVRDIMRLPLTGMLTDQHALCEMHQLCTSAFADSTRGGFDQLDGRSPDLRLYPPAPAMHMLGQRMQSTFALGT